MPRLPSARPSKPVKPINLALQGGGAHGAFTWGVLDALLQDGHYSLESISATSAGSLNAVALAHGMRLHGPDGARQSLADMWRAVAQAGQTNPMHPPWLDAFMHGLLPSAKMEQSPFYFWSTAMTQMFSPYQLNPLNFNPLRDILKGVDFEALAADPPLKLYLSATDVETGKIKVFSDADVSMEAVLASACLPTLFQAVEVGGHFYWDGGYMGNPAIFPLIYESVSADVLIVHVNPVVRRGVPTSAGEIANRVNEISFNSSLMRELRAIAFVTSLIDKGKLAEADVRRMRIHCIRCDELMVGQGVASKMDTSWPYLCRLRDAGREQAQAWIEAHGAMVGKRSSVDIRAEFL